MKQEPWTSDRLQVYSKKDFLIGTKCLLCSLHCDSELKLCVISLWLFLSYMTENLKCYLRIFSLSI